MKHSKHAIAVALVTALTGPTMVFAQSPGSGTGSSTGGGPAGSAGSARCGDSICQQIVVRLAPSESIETINNAYGTTTIRSMQSHGMFLLQLPPNASPSVMQNGLGNDPRVAWAEMNFVMVAPNGGTQSFFLSATFNDYLHQPALAVIEADAAHRLAPARAQIVAVLDTGVDPNHRMISGRLATGGYNYIDNNTDFRDIGNGIDDNGNGLIDEMVGHGTMVSGLIVRIAPQSRILPMRVLNCDGVGASFYVAQAIYDSIAAGASVINISLGSIRPSQAIADAVDAAHQNGIVVVAAAGNTGRSEPMFYPAAFQNVLSVAGSDNNDRKAPMSDYGAWIDMTAPAVTLTSAYPGIGGGGGVSNVYATSSGNSLAAALVSGSAVMVRSQQPWLRPQQVMATLKATSTNIDHLNPEYIGMLGSGRLNVRDAVTMPTGARPRP